VVASRIKGEVVLAVVGQYVRSSGLVGLRKVVEDAGGRYESMLARVGFVPEDVETVDTLLSFRSCAALLETIANETGVPDIGVKLCLANHPHFPNLGPVVFLAKFCKTLRDWEQAARDYWDYHTNCMILERIDDPVHNESILRYEFKGLGLQLRQQTEYIIANIIGIIRAVTRRADLAPLLVRVRHQRLDDCHSLDEYANCPVEFGAEHTEIVFKSEILDYPTQGDLTNSQDILRTYVQSRMKNLEFRDGSVSEHVKLAIASLLGTGKSDIKFTAELLGIHTKALQRQLGEEGATYSALLDEVREKMALDMLRHSRVPIAAIARLLGYASPPPFTSAFKRWTGKLPMQVRNSF
jgi:AraC-like DNA-binding protein